MDEKVELWSTKFNKEKLNVYSDKYNLFEDKYGTFHVIQKNSSWNFIPKDVLDRTFTENAIDVVANRRKWLIEKVLQRRIRELKNVTDEIDALSNWLNENQKNILSGE